MSLIGKGTSSLRKKDVKEQKSVAIGFKKVRFAHKATLGDSGINLTALVTPPEMSSNGFVNASQAGIDGAKIYAYRNNLKLVSSLKGLLVDQLSYVVASSTQINFIGFTAEDGEIFTGWIDDVAATQSTVVDGRSIVATGTLTVGQTDFNIGTPIVINQNPGYQMGAVMVFRNGLIQARCDGNMLSGVGNYIEVPVAGGLGSLIRFKVPGADDAIMVMSNGVVAERPDGSMLAAIERVAGQVDAMVPTLAAVAGVPQTNFQTAPNDIDLKQFGDTVVSHGQRITALENKKIKAAIYQAVSTGVSAATVINYNTMIKDDFGMVVTGVNWKFTAQDQGFHDISGAISAATAGTGTAAGFHVYVNGSQALLLRASDVASGSFSGAGTLYLNVGDQIDLRLSQNFGSVSSSAGYNSQVCITYRGA